MKMINLVSIKVRVAICILIILTGFFSCKPGKTNNEGYGVRDSTITAQNAYLNLFLDSNAVTQFLANGQFLEADSVRISHFYKERNYQFAWFDTLGIAEQALNALNLISDYASLQKDPALVDSAVAEQVQEMATDTGFIKKNFSLLVPTELGLTSMFFRYAAKKYTGQNNLDLKELGWFIPRKKLDLTLFLDSLVANKGKSIENYEPAHPLFGALTEKLKFYSQLESKGGWPQIPAAPKGYRLGDSLPGIAPMKQYLHLVGDLATADSSLVFDSTLLKAVLQWQMRFGLQQDGIIGKEALAEMNVPVQERIKQLLINLERIKWVPVPGKNRYLVVNIPAFKLYAFDKGKLDFTMKVVTGSAANSTVVFSGMIETIAFSPYWNVPYSIVKNEMGRSASYFSKRNMEIVGRYSDGLPMVRQKPGPWNALGRVKFLFPNSYAIYLHDTPSKSTFDRTNRAASHGCVRVEKPIELAQYLLDYDPNWTLDGINKSMKLDKEKKVNLRDKVPVYIGYFTSWVDAAGLLHIRKDIYKHDEEMARRLFTEETKTAAKP